MYITLILISTILLSAYILLFIYTNIGWRKVRNQKMPATESNTFISIIIPFRNELNNLKNLMASLNNQNYSNDKFEVIMIDDHSEDGGYEYLEKNRKTYSFTLILHKLPENRKFKKNAIEEGVAKSKGKLIITSDADTVRQSQWISEIAAFYDKNKPALIILPVMLNQGENFIQRFQVLEFLSLQWITASFAGNNNAILCNGANLAFEKEIFQKIGAYNDTPNVVSGDDFFLLFKVKKLFRNRISYLFSKNALVFTPPQSSHKDFIQQRLRWAGKTKYSRNMSIYLTGIYNIIISFWLIFLPIMEYNSSSFPIISILFWSVKLIGDYLMIQTAAKLFNIKVSLNEFLFSIIYYPFYICSIFIFSLFIKVKWKEREI